MVSKNLILTIRSFIARIEPGSCLNAECGHLDICEEVYHGTIFGLQYVGRRHQEERFLAMVDYYLMFAFDSGASSQGWNVRIFLLFTYPQPRQCGEAVGSYEWSLAT